MVGGGEIVVPRDHLEKRHPRGVAYTDDVIPLLFGVLNDANSTLTTVDGKLHREINFTPLLLTAAAMYASSLRAC